MRDTAQRNRARPLRVSIACAGIDAEEQRTAPGVLGASGALNILATDSVMATDTSIYLDYQASTPLDPRVREAVLPWLAEEFGNPSSVQHERGRRAADAIERARVQVADLLGAQAREIVFTGGATEANNLAIKGVASAHEGRAGHLLSCRTEHPAVLEPIRVLVQRGWDATYLSVDTNGDVDLSELDASLRDDTALVSVMFANNEIGGFHPLDAISDLAHSCGALVHTDAAQAIGKLPLNVETLGVDLLSVSGHKVYAPQGIGALYVRNEVRARVAPQIHGGGHESGRRSGTLNTAGCVGLGEACAIAQRELDRERVRVAKLRDRLEHRLRAGDTSVLVNGPPSERRLAGTLHVTFPGADADAVMTNCPEVAMAAGSACASSAPAPSHVLTALGMPAELAECSLRISLGRFTTADEVERAASSILAAVSRVRVLTGYSSHAQPMATA